MRPIASLENVTFRYPNSQSPVLDSLSLEVKAGEFLGIMGKTGCGKTTLLLALNGIVPKLVKGVFSGEVTVDGADVSKKSVEEMSRTVAYVFQDPNDQIFALSAFEEVAFALTLRKTSPSEVKRKVESSLKAVGLQGFEEKDPSTLSQGQKQKLAIATALAMDTPLLVLDEPVASLDYESATHVYEILSALRKQGKTIIVTEHDSQFLYANASRIALMDRGRIALHGGMQVLKSSKMKEFGLRRVK